MDNNLAIIIEDEKDLALMFAQALADAGLRPEIFYDGGPALSRLIEVAPTIVVVDLNLPNIAGDEVIDLLKHDPRLAETKSSLLLAAPSRPMPTKRLQTWFWLNRSATHS